MDGLGQGPVAGEKRLWSCLSHHVKPQKACGASSVYRNKMKAVLRVFNYKPN